MDVFGGAWEGMWTTWPRACPSLQPEDTLVIAGDISWGMSLEEAEADFAWLDALPGTKILMKGNHDYWWNTASKMNRFSRRKGSLPCAFSTTTATSTGGDRPVRDPRVVL